MKPGQEVGKIGTVHIKSSFQNLDYEGGEREREGEKLEGDELLCCLFLKKKLEETGACVNIGRTGLVEVER